MRADFPAQSAHRGRSPSGRRQGWATPAPVTYGMSRMPRPSAASEADPACSYDRRDDAYLPSGPRPWQRATPVPSVMPAAWPRPAIRRGPRSASRRLLTRVQHQSAVRPCHDRYHHGVSGCFGELGPGGAPAIRLLTCSRRRVGDVAGRSAKSATSSGWNDFNRGVRHAKQETQRPTCQLPRQP